jgi:hypothetical protein
MKTKKPNLVEIKLRLPQNVCNVFETLMFAHGIDLETIGAGADAIAGAAILCLADAGGDVAGMYLARMMVSMAEQLGTDPAKRARIEKAFGSIPSVDEVMALHTAGDSGELQRRLRAAEGGVA